MYCGWRFLTAEDDAGLTRWGIGLLFCTIVALNGKVSYWMETGRLATLEEVKRLELLIAHLACELRERTTR